MLLACDMNCNNFGNFFLIIGDPRYGLEQIDSGWQFGNTGYPGKHCYRVANNCRYRIEETFIYSEAIDNLAPSEYIKWQNNRFSRERGR